MKHIRQQAGKKILSVIIPMYNAGRTIQKCLESLILPSEQMDRLEILVVDDGSTDDGAGYVKQFQLKYQESIQLIAKPNGGHGSAVNEAVKRCTGKYFKILDADDWVHTDSLAKAVQLLAEVHAQVVACGYDRYQVQTGQMIHVGLGHGMTYSAHSRIIYMDMHSLIKNWHHCREIFCLHGLIYQTEFYKKLPYQLPEGVYYDDAFYFTVPCSHAGRICIIDMQLYVYRIGEASQSVSAVNREKRYKQHELVIGSILETAEYNSAKSWAGREYWYRKLASTTADYFITVFLRFNDRKKGRRAAKDFLRKIRHRDFQLYKRILAKYWILYILGRAGCNESSFAYAACRAQKSDVIQKRNKTGDI